jgi:nucleotide-binding universal stress UspA family protein
LYVEPPAIMSGGTMVLPDDLAAVHAALETIRKRTDGVDLKYPVETRFREGDVVQAILDTARKEDCGLIVLGTHGRTGLARLLMGSVAEGVLRRASCPVLAVKTPLKPTEAAPAGAGTPHSTAMVF